MENEKDVVAEDTEMTQEVTAEVTENEVTDEPTEVLTPEMVEQMVRDAEERGYLKGRNEAVEALMDRPGYGGKPTEGADEDDGEDAMMILREMRRSVWD